MKREEFVEAAGGGYDQAAENGFVAGAPRDSGLEGDAGTRTPLDSGTYSQDKGGMTV